MKGQKTALHESHCAIARALDVIGDWWSLLIVREALYGKRRFSEFEKALGLAKNILSTRLKKLVDYGVLATVPAPDNAAHKHYVLTEKGAQLHVVLIALYQWGEKNCFGDNEQPIRLVDSLHEAPLKPLQLRSQDNRILGPADLKVLGAAEDANAPS